MGMAGLVAAAQGAAWCRHSTVLDGHRATVILVLGTLAAYLLQGGRRDERVQHLGALFLLIAVFFAHPAIEPLLSVLPEAWALLPRAIASVSIDAFTPALAWLFLRDFPRALESRRRAQLVMGAIWLCVGAAIVLVVVGLAIGIRPEWGFVPAGCEASTLGTRGALALLDRADLAGLYWTIVLGLVLPAIPFGFWRGGQAPADERRRVRLFVSVLAVAAVLPVSFAVLPTLSTEIAALATSAWASAVLVPLNLLMILTMAAVTAYSVAVQQVLDVPTLLRRAAQYALARGVLAVLVVTPFMVLAYMAYEGRAEPLGALFSGLRPLAAVGLVGAGLFVVGVRRRVMLTVDRFFFREDYDSREVFAAVAASTRSDGPTMELARSVTEIVDGALHPETAALFAHVVAERAFVPMAGGLRSLTESSPLAALIHDASEPVQVDLRRPAAGIEALPQEDRIWLADSACRMLVPLTGSAGTAWGFLVLGAKRSELPYSREDLLLLSAIGNAAGVGLENRILRSSSADVPGRAEQEDVARECEPCGRIAMASAAECSFCGGALRPSLLPPLAFGKFELRRRIGRGAMGVVYRAQDNTLQRAIALKTLPFTTPEDSFRLRREARAMAAITHPNLALIHGAETWRGIPILVIEYLAGGTLADRLAEGPLGLKKALELSALIARVLQEAHGAGILHRDVKPSNIGFTENGTPKLLDFGLARITGESPRTLPESGRIDETGFAGTPRYMSPEALQLGRPEPGFDLWSLGIVAFEAAWGRHPFESGSSPATMAAIQRGWTEKQRRLMPDCPEALVSLFERALAADRSHRPSTAVDLSRELEAAAASLP